MNHLNRTKTIGIKVSESAFETLRKVAEGQGKHLGEWCRDALMRAALRPPPRPSELAMVAEITATQAILIDMLCIFGRDGRIATPKAQEIVDRAHNAKYKEALQLLGLAYSKAEKLNLEVFAHHECLAKTKEHTG
jgi:hypothetical protein